jgi:hypothetical protein
MPPDLTNIVHLPRGSEGVLLAVADEMCSRWPVFTWPPIPLALGSGVVIITALTAPPRPASLSGLSQDRIAEAASVVLGKWANGALYLASCRAGRPRYHVGGGQLGIVTRDEEEWARGRLLAAYDKWIADGYPPPIIGDRTSFETFFAAG